jgi:hypothetical protein
MMRRLLPLALLVIGGTAPASPAAAQGVPTADVTIRLEKIQAPAGAVTQRWFQVTVTNGGPDPIDAAPPREHFVRLDHSPVSILDNGPGARCRVIAEVLSRCELDPLLPVSGSQSFQFGVQELGPSDPFTSLRAMYSDGPVPWITDPDRTNNEALIREQPADGGDGQCTIATMLAHPAFEPLARNSIRQLRDVRLRRLRAARIDNLLTCEAGRVKARLERLGRRRAVIAKVDREFDFGSVGRQSPRFELTRAGRKLAADPPARIRVRATLRLFDVFGDVYTYSTTFRMTRGRAG